MTKSSYYKEYKKLYEEKILASPEVTEPQNLTNIIDNIVQIIRNVNPNFNRNSIKFNRLEMNSKMMSFALIIILFIFLIN